MSMPEALLAKLVASFKYSSFLKQNILQVLLSEKDAPPAGCAFENVNEKLAVYLQAEGKVDAEAELEKMRNKMDEIQK
jgi:dsRNA-specific ribonuclease